MFEGFSTVLLPIKSIGQTESLIGELPINDFGFHLTTVSSNIQQIRASKRNSIMTVFTGNDSDNVLMGTSSDDQLFGLGGNDLLDGNFGFDLLDGGNGNDTTTYAFYNGGINTNLQTGIVSFPGNSNRTDRLISIENVIGSQGNDVIIGDNGDNNLSGGAGNDTLDGGFGFDRLDGGDGVDTVTYDFFGGSINANLETGVVGFPGNSNRVDTLIGIENLIGSRGNDGVVGNNLDNALSGNAGNDTILSSLGNDLLDGGSGIDIADYSSLDRAMTLLPGGVVSKNGLGFDRLNAVEWVIGAVGQANTVDGSNGRGFASFNMDLGANRLVVSGLPVVGSFTFTIQNFVNARGTVNQDVIVGSNAANFIDGGAGNDILVGSGSNDTIVGNEGADNLTGTDGVVRGNGEYDNLTGGLGADRFVLGDRNGSFYQNNSSQDYVLINDFDSSDLIQLGAGNSYRVRRDRDGFDLFVNRNGIRDLIADVRTTSLIRPPFGAFSLASGQVLGNFIGA
jgi:Ca2+-binding RTX toxin-like protein